MANSTHKVEIVPIVLEPHPNADSLSIVKVFGGYPVVVKTEDWKNAATGAYIPPDSLVDVRRNEFTFLADAANSEFKARIKARRFRGVQSFGLLVPNPTAACVGTDVTEQLGVTHYDPEQHVSTDKSKRTINLGGEISRGPVGLPMPGMYDLEAFRRYHNVFCENERVIVTEKLDGSNARYVYYDGEYHCGSRKEWKKEFPSYDHLSVESLIEQGCKQEKAVEIMDTLQKKPKKQNLWWQILRETPDLEKWLRDNPGKIVFGEVFGNTNRIKYGLSKGNEFAAFDIWHDGRWYDFFEGFAQELPWVPILECAVPYTFNMVADLAEGKSVVEGCDPDTIREGVVVQPCVERWDHRCGRVKLKCVSGQYLEKVA